MATVDLFAIGNALIDQEFRVSDHFLTEQNLQKMPCNWLMVTLKPNSTTI